MKPIYPLHVFFALAFATSFTVTSATHAQVNGPGISPSGDFNTVINIPTDPDLGDGAVIGGGSDETTQLNLLNGGSIGIDFTADAGSEVNISGGNVGDNFFAGNSEVNISGGVVESDFVIGNSTVDISGGTVGNPDSVFRSLGGSDVTISDGVIGGTFLALQQSTVSVSGGSLGDVFNVLQDSTADISGGDFGSFINIRGGSEVDISGGNFAFNPSSLMPTEFEISNSIVNISGGEFAGPLSADDESTVNLIGTEFFLDGNRIDPLSPSVPITVDGRDVSLSGTLLDGSSFDFFLNSNEGPDFFSENSTITVLAVPEPSGTAILLVGVAVSLLVRRRD